MLLKTLSNTYMQQTREMPAVWRLQWKRVRRRFMKKRFMKKRGKRRKREGENEMGLLSYKIVRGTCLGFSEQLQVVVTCDVLQQRLTTAAMGLSVLLETVKQWELRNRFIYLLRIVVILSTNMETHCILVFLLFKRNGVSLPPHLCHLFFIPQLSLHLGLEVR